MKILLPPCLWNYSFHFDQGFIIHILFLLAVLSKQNVKVILPCAVKSLNMSAIYQLRVVKHDCHILTEEG